MIFHFINSIALNHPVSTTYPHIQPVSSTLLPLKRLICFHILRQNRAEPAQQFCPSTPDRASAVHNYSCRSHSPHTIPSHPNPPHPSPGPADPYRCPGGTSACKCVGWPRSPIFPIAASSFFNFFNFLHIHRLSWFQQVHLCEIPKQESDQSRRKPYPLRTIPVLPCGSATLMVILYFNAIFSTSLSAGSFSPLHIPAKEKGTF